MRNVLRLPEPPTPALSAGGLVHEVLEAHARRWRDAEADGRAPPSASDLEALTRERYGTRVRSGEATGEGGLEEVLLMAAHGHEMMEAAGVEILEIEHRIAMPYECGGQTHRLIAKLDRIDRTAEGVRIVDYKTGGASQARLSPKKTDLQLGIYALALRHAMPETDGVAEYWVLRTGQRGTISLAEFDEGKIRAKIDEAVRGMLAGEFPRKAGSCSGMCAILFGGA